MKYPAITVTAFSTRYFSYELKSLFDKLIFLGEPYNSFIDIEAESSYLIFVTGDVYCL